jgi:recombination protein RecA
VRLDIRKTETLKNKESEEIGNRVKVKVAKNKVAPPFRIAEFDIIYGKGICALGNILDVAVNFEIVKKAGAWFSYNDEKLGQGRDKSKEFLEENPKILEEIELKVREKLKEKQKANKMVEAEEQQ